MTPFTGEHMDWQPIETAPKDGTHILAFRDEAGHSRTPVSIAWNIWHEAWGNHPAPDGTHGVAFKPVKNQPTHWIPMPGDPPFTGERD